MVNKRGGIFFMILLALVILIIGFIWFMNNMKMETNVDVNFTRKGDSANQEDLAQIANPASHNCLDKGHKLEIRYRDDGTGQEGICIDSLGEECEEWSYFEGECFLNEGVS